jgi:thioredoxin-like negative regulator of GroEL
LNCTIDSPLSAPLRAFECAPEALNFARTALARDNKNVQTLTLLTQLNIYAGNFEQAQIRLNQAKTADRNDPKNDMSNSLKNWEEVLKGLDSSGAIPGS